jgi:hypothetical protein
MPAQGGYSITSSARVSNGVGRQHGSEHHGDLDAH